MTVNKARVLEELRRQGWSLVRDIGFTNGRTIESAVLREVCALIGTPSSRDGDQPVWPVQPRSTAPDATFSMRSGAAALHTDAAYRVDPEPWVALFCVRPARDGGISTLLSAGDLRQ